MNFVSEGLRQFIEHLPANCFFVSFFRGQKTPKRKREKSERANVCLMTNDKFSRVERKLINDLQNLIKGVDVLAGGSCSKVTRKCFWECQ